METKEYFVENEGGSLTPTQGTLISRLKNKLKRSQWHKHRSTWMIAALLLSLLMLILAFTVAAPAVEVLLAVFSVVIFITKIFASSSASIDSLHWIFSNRNYFDTFKIGSTNTVIKLSLQV